MPVTQARVRELALALENAIEVVHGDRPAFRTPRKIFATLPAGAAVVNLELDPAMQEFFCEQAPGVITPHPSGWGRLGATCCDLDAIDEATLLSALKAAHALAAPKPKKTPRSNRGTGRGARIARVPRGSGAPPKRPRRKR
jgi:hypothetical protein